MFSNITHLRFENTVVKEGLQYKKPKENISGLSLN